jgi:CHAT domain-containing protein
MKRVCAGGILPKAFRIALWGALLALLLSAAPAQLTAQDSGTAGPPRAEQPAPAEPGRFGANLRDLDADAIKALGLDQPHALLINYLNPEGPAESAGFKPADVIVKVNGNPAPNVNEFIQQIKQMGRGAELQLDIWRRGERMSLSARLGSAKEKAKEASPEQLIEAYNAILAVFNKDTFPILWARAKDGLGFAYWKRIRGSRAENIEAAIKAYQAALTVYTREAFPEDWARTQSNLGLAYGNRAQGNGAENLETAIRAFEAALTVYTQDAFPQDWALTQINLGAAWDRFPGSRAANIEAAIKAYEAALTVLTREPFRQDWALTQTNLGKAYWFRVQGSLAENIEAAIKAFELALTVYTSDAFPEDWAGAQLILGELYRARIHGDRAENIEAAIKAYEAALTVHTRETFPQDWAATQNDLGNAYSDRIQGSRAENLEAAIKAYESALTVYTREAFPPDWALTQNNLGAAYWFRIQGSRAENLEAAIKAYESALTVYTLEAIPQEWAMTQNNLGSAYAVRIQGSRAENLEAAIKAYEAALAVRTREAFPRDHLLTARTLADVWTQRGNWVRARDTLAGARDAFFILFGQGVINEIEARHLISQAGSLFADLAYAEAENGDVKAALATLSEGRAILLAAALRQQSLALTPQEEIAYRSLQLEIREWAKLAEAKGTEGAEALRHLSAVRGKFSALVREASRRSQIEGGIDVIAGEGLLKDAALVAPIVKSLGSKILIVTVADNIPAIAVTEFPELTSATLQALLRQTGEAGQASGWLVDYERQQTDPKAWRAAIEGIGPKLWTLFAGKLDGALKKAGVKDGARLIVLPTGALGFLPLELARDPVSGRSFAEAYNVTEVPSLEAYLAAARTAAKAGPPSLAEAVNPTGDIPGLGLPYTEVEGALVASRFKGKPLIKLDRTSATPDVVLAGLKGKSYWHFASHGLFDWDDARQSGLMMKDKQLLTVGALLDARGTLGAPRLVVLSACETGLFDTAKNPDEFVGLPAAFLQLGAGGVIGSLWEVDDLATALLMAKFYELHLDGGLAPADALKQAKAWLRNATNRELIAYAKAAQAASAPQSQAPDLVAVLSTGRRGSESRFAGMWDALQEAGAERGKRAKRGKGKPAAASLDAKRFAHPYYWSGFVYTGY